MELILLKDVEGLGREGETVKVSEGYGRNFLIPRKLAAPITAAVLRKLEKLRQQREAATRAELEKARELAKRLGEISVSLARKTADGDKLFGSVTASDIAEALKQQGIEIDKKQIILPEHIKELGIFNVPIKLNPEVEASLKVWIVEE